jgi:hypothetical protein
LKRKILLTFDIEEFDLPLEYNCAITPEEQMKVSLEGLERMNSLLDKHFVTSTCFVTSHFAVQNPAIIKLMAGKHEIGSHTYRHSTFEEGDIEKSKTDIEGITGAVVEGFRMPRLQTIDYSRLKTAGYSYDSSLNPTFLPGRYNHTDKPRILFREPGSGIPILPMSVSPLLRFPLFWLSFKNIPLPLYFHFCRRCLGSDSYLHLYFHPWEFADLSSFKIPAYIKNLSGNDFTKKFDKLLIFLGKQGEFSTISNFLNQSGILK